MTFKLKLLLYLLLFSAQGISQPFVDLFNSRFQSFPGISYSGESKKNLSATQWQTSLLAPVVRKNKDVFLVGLNYSLLNFTVKGDTTYSTTLRSHGVHVGYNKQWKNEKWKTLFLFIARANTRLSDLTSTDMQYGGVLLFNYKHKENVRYRLGLYYNREYFGNFFIPLVGIEWKINKSLNFFGDLPNSLNLEKKFHEKFYAGIIFLSMTSSYRTESTSNVDDFIREGEKGVGHNQLKLFLNYYVTKHLVVYAEAGKTYGRSFQLFQNNIETDFSNSVFRKTTESFLFNGGVAFRFRKED
jgi:hypothetical protein